MLTISQAVREVLKTVPYPITISLQELTDLSNEKLRESGNLKDQVKKHNASQARTNILNSGVKILNKDSIEKYEEDNCWRTDKKGPQQITTKYKSAAAAILDALLTVENPDSCPVDRIMAIAIAKTNQSGQSDLSKRINKVAVSQYKSHITSRFGKPLTKNKIVEYQNSLGKKQPSKIIQPTRKFELSITLSMLKAAMTFAKEMRGFDEAIQVLTILKEGNGL